MARHASGRRPAVTMLLIGEPVYDPRVTKTARSLVDAGYAVTIVCIPLGAGATASTVGGAAVLRCSAARPLRALRRVLGRPGREEAAAQAAAPSAAPRCGAPPKWVREARILAGTFWLNLALARSALAIPADVIHANDLDTLWAGTWLARKQGARLIYDSHELFPEMLPETSPLLRGILRQVEHRLIGRADAVITVNQALAGELQRRHRLRVRPTVVMNCPRLQPLPPDIGEAADQIGMIYLGALHAERGLEILLEAMPRIDRRVVLYIRGSGPLRALFEARAKDPALMGRIVLHEPVPAEKVVDALAGMTIGIIPYVATSLNNYLSSPTKLFDYFMAGLAVVATDLPEIRRAVTHYDAGELPTADAEAIARAVNRLAADPERRRHCRIGARAAAEREFHWADQERALLGVYGEKEQ